MKRVISLAALSLVLLGAECEYQNPGGPPPPPPPGLAAGLFFEAPVTLLSPGTEFTATIFVVVIEEPLIHAYDVSLDVDPAVVEIVAIDPHPEYDDDGAFFLAPIIDAAKGTATGMADLRHGPPGGPLLARLATLTLRAVAPGVAYLDASANGLASASGEEYSAFVSSKRIEVGP